jgi:predicted RNA-binding Zn-ribbon protein involved in translation (DUF1610 family)
MSGIIRIITRRLVFGGMPVLLLGALLSPAGITLAQAELPEDTIVTVSQLDVSQYPEITIYVSVTDEDGQPLPLLDQANFSLSEDGQPVEIVDFAGIGESRPVDVIFAFDTTGSMGDEIYAMIGTSIAFAQELEDRGRDYRLGLVTFGDEVRGVYSPDNSLTSDARVFQDWMRSLVADGGNEDPENDYGALKRATQMQFRSGSQVIFILITDAALHHYGDPPDGGFSFDDSDLNLEPMLALFSERAVTVHVVGPDLPELLSLTEQTSGSFYNISTNPNFTGMIADIGETIANQYRITYHSPRPTYDGTRRNVNVTVGEAEAGVAYVETHLLNIQSELWIGAICLLPMLAGLAVPPLVQLIQKTLKPSRAIPALTTNISMPPAAQPEIPAPAPSAGFQATPAVHPESFSPESTQPPTCPACGRAIRPGAQFCPQCGKSLHQASPPRPAIPTMVELEPPPGGFPAGTTFIPSQDSKTSASDSSNQPNSCPVCGRELRPGSRFCPRCGKPL